MDLYADQNFTKETSREGLVVKIVVPPCEHSDMPIQLIVVSNPGLFQEKYETSKYLLGMLPTMKLPKEKLENVGLTAMTVEEIPEEQRPRWEKEISGMERTFCPRRESQS